MPNYTNSSLVTVTMLSPYYSSRNGTAIDTITIHCTAGNKNGTAAGTGAEFQRAGKNASSNYGVGGDGSVGLYVEESNRSWCSSNGDNDRRAVTIEVASTNYYPYEVTNTAYEKTIELVADICQRNGIKELKWKGDPSLIGQVDKQNMTVHRWFAAKACVPLNTEVLTEKGWIKLSEIKIGDRIACASLDGLKISFEEVEDIVEPYSADTYTNNGLTATKDHRIVYSKWNKKDNYKITDYAELLNYNGNIFIPLAGNNRNLSKLNISNERIAFLIAIQSDGYYELSTAKNARKNDYVAINFHFSKQRKIKRLEYLLNILGYTYTKSISKNNTTKFRISKLQNPNLFNDIENIYLKNKQFTWKWLNMNKSQADFFINEIMLWDGCKSSNSFWSEDKQNIDVISAVAVLNGYGSNISKDNKSIQIYKSSHMTLGNKPESTVRNIKDRKSTKELTTVSCVTVKTGIFICRQNGKTFVIGNCPGDYLYNRMSDIANRVNELLGSGYRNPGVPVSGGGAGTVPTNPGGTGGTSGGNGGTSTVGSAGSSSYKPHDYDGSEASTVKSTRTNRKTSSVSALRSKIDKANDYIMKNHDVTPFITFSVNDFSLDTRDADSFKHYAISLENQKTGVGQGNQFKLKIAYHKDFSNYDSINQLELALGPLRRSSIFAQESSDIMTSVKTDLNRNTCTLQYGYITDDANLISPEYTGLLLKYSVNANKQIVEYTLEGFTGEQAAINTVNWYPNVEGMDYITSEGERYVRGNVCPKSYSNSMTESEIEQFINKMNNEWAGGFTYNPYFALSAFLDDYNANVLTGSTTFRLVDCTDGTKGRLGAINTLKPVRMSICKGQTPIQYIEYCISLFKYQKTDNYAIQYLKQQQQTQERFIYNLVRDPDNDNQILICIDYLDSSEVDDAQIAYKFYGYTPSNVLMIDYNLNYDGTVALAISDNYDDNISDNAIYVGSDGALRARVSITRDMFVAAEIDDVLIAKQNTWLDKVSVANNCTMTTFGLPFEISVGTVFRCGLYISETLHHTSGNCFVTGIVDKIENNMFTTTFTMIRLPGKNNDIDS